MAYVPIRQLGDPALKEKALPVQDIDSSITVLVDDLARMMDQAEGIGLAATQIGILRQVFVFTHQDVLKAYINPTITNLTEETETEEEGCLSLPRGLHMPVSRTSKILFRAQNLSGETEEFEVEGLLARVFQHEVDHLNGLLIIDRTSAENRRNAFKLIKEGIIVSSSQQGAKAL